jgi:hypothetical protein
VNTEPVSEFSFGLELGALVRGNAVYQIKSGAMRYGVRLEIAESRGLFESEYCFRVSGPVSKVSAYRQALKAWLAAQSD